MNTAAFHHHDAELLADPWPVYAAMRETCPVARSERYGGFWIISRYVDVLDAARNPEIFASSSGVVIPAIPSPTPLIPFEVDPPLHRQYRLLELRHLAPKEVARLEPTVRNVARSLLAGLRSRGGGDFVVDFALPFTSTIFCQLMGVPESKRPAIVAWTGKILERASRPDEAATAVGQFYEFLDTFLIERRDSPADDLTTVLLQAEVDGRPLTAAELRSMCFTLLVAGLETTILSIGTNLRYLSDHPDLRRRLIDEPGLIPGAVEEFLRTDGPVQGHVRTLTRDVVVHGRQLHAGDKVLLLWASANRDPSEFEDAEQFRPDRRPNRHFAFGAGPHRCVGSHLATLELVIALQEVLAIVPDYALAREPEMYPTARGVRRLPVTIPVRA